jgi:hypothetical protein
MQTEGGVMKEAGEDRSEEDSQTRKSERDIKTLPGGS